MSSDTASISTGRALHIVTAILVALFALAATVVQSPAQMAGETARGETLWIFDADFEDLLGDNVGWVAPDQSGVPPIVNYWHRDTLRPSTCCSTGNYSWWCGTENPCWRQPRGYGNDWFCCLERDFPLAEWSIAGDMVTLEFCHRYAMERRYDYGYVDISDDSGSSWTTFASYTNGGFVSPGLPVDWVLEVLDVSAYAGADVRVRYRFESDPAYSSQDQWDNPPQHSVKDGAWQVAAISLSVNGQVAWSDDCGDSTDNSWEHTSVPWTGQTGTAFRPLGYGVDLWTNRPPYPGEPAIATRMQAAVDTSTGRMVDDQNSWLVSPPVYVFGVPRLVCVWEGWVDFPPESNDVGHIYVGTGDIPECITFSDLELDPLEIGPEWTREVLDWDAYAGSDWLKVAWSTWGGEPDPEEEHMGGLFLNRVRIGVPLDTGVPDDEVLERGITRVYPNPFNPSTTIEYALARQTHAVIRVVDPSGRVVATLLDAQVGPGPAHVRWDGTTASGDRAASGVYFVTLSADGEVSTRKMVLLK